MRKCARLPSRMKHPPSYCLPPCSLDANALAPANGLIMPNTSARTGGTAACRQAGHCHGILHTNGYGGSRYDSSHTRGTATTATGIYPSATARDAIASEAFNGLLTAASTLQRLRQGYIDDEGPGYQNFAFAEMTSTQAALTIASQLCRVQPGHEQHFNATHPFTSTHRIREYYSGGLLNGPTTGCFDMVYGIDAYVDYCGYAIAWAYTQNTDIHSSKTISPRRGSASRLLRREDAGRPMIPNLYNPNYDHAIAAWAIQRHKVHSLLQHMGTGTFTPALGRHAGRNMYIDGCTAWNWPRCPSPPPSAIHRTGASLV
jgi:hypothetical protein